MKVCVGALSKTKPLLLVFNQLIFAIQNHEF